MSGEPELARRLARSLGPRGVLELPYLRALRRRPAPFATQAPPVAPPPLGLRSTPRALHGPSSLRWSPGRGPLPLDHLMLGNVQYRRRPREWTPALRHWLCAYAYAEPVSLARQLGSVLAENVLPAPDSALAWFHVACHEDTLPRAYAAFDAALSLEPALEHVLHAMVDAAAGDKRFCDAIAPLSKLFSAPSSTAHRLQVELVQEAKRGAWQAVASRADVLVEIHPQLLVPRCLQFLAALYAPGVGGGDDGQDGDEQNELGQAAEDLMVFVRRLDADGHQLAVGATSKEILRWAWRSFLVEATDRGIADFDGSLATGEDGVTASRPDGVAPGERRWVEGLPWSRALELPFARPWDEEAACWRSRRP